MDRTQELITAIKSADLNNIERLIQEGANLNATDEEQSSYGIYWTPLHHCIFRGGSTQSTIYTEIAALLLQNGANIEAVNYTGETPFLFALKFYALEIADLLVTRGANVRAENNDHRNAFDVVLERYYYDQQLDEDHIDDAETTAEKKAIRNGEGESLTYLFKRIDSMVRNGYDLNEGRFSAAFCALLEVTENKLPAKAFLYLFDKGANPREILTPKEGAPFPLFDEACHRKFADNVLLEMAKRMGVNFVFEQYANYTPLLIAIRNNNAELVKSLLGSGADLHIQNDRPLRIASSLGNQGIVEFLVEQGALVNSADAKGNTALSLAEKGGFMEIVEYLKLQSR
jgi:ankyrin